MPTSKFTKDIRKFYLANAALAHMHSVWSNERLQEQIALLIQDREQTGQWMCETIYARPMYSRLCDLFDSEM